MKNKKFWRDVKRGLDTAIPRMNMLVYSGISLGLYDPIKRKLGADGRNY